MRQNQCYKHFSHCNLHFIYCELIVINTIDNFNIKNNKIIDNFLELFIDITIDNIILNDMITIFEIISFNLKNFLFFNWINDNDNFTIDKKFKKNLKNTMFVDNTNFAKILIIILSKKMKNKTKKWILSMKLRRTLRMIISIILYRLTKKNLKISRKFSSISQTISKNRKHNFYLLSRSWILIRIAKTNQQKTKKLSVIKLYRSIKK